MTSPDLPAELKAALDGKLRGFSRSDAAGHAASISKTYRDGGIAARKTPQLAVERGLQFGGEVG